MARQRRQRYRAHLERDGLTSERLILAYEPDSVREHYTRMGYHVLGVEDGRAKRAPAPPVTEPWTVDARAIQRACEFLGIELPVTWKLTAPAGAQAACHELQPTGGRVRKHPRGWAHIDTATGLKHHITIKRWLTRERASESLWHELAHAMQAERAIRERAADAGVQDRYMAWYHVSKEQTRGITYRRKSHEVEAREYEPLGKTDPLVLPARS